MPFHSLVVGYHGCDDSLVQSVVTGKDDLKPSQNAWDWLGHGIYFWEDSPARALRWAEAEAQRRGSNIKTPAVLGAVIQLGNCLNLTETEALTLVSETGVPDDVYERVREQFSEDELVHLSLAIVSINGCNRLNIAARTVPGDYMAGSLAKLHAAS